jgi:hypothetical protein
MKEIGAIDFEKIKNNLEEHVPVKIETSIM